MFVVLSLSSQINNQQQQQQQQKWLIIVSVKKIDCKLNVNWYCNFIIIGNFFFLRDEMKIIHPPPPTMEPTDADTEQKTDRRQKKRRTIKFNL